MCNFFGFQLKLGKLARHKRTNICVIPLYEVPGVVKFIKTESRMVVARAWRGWYRKFVFNGYGIEFGEDDGDGCTTM